VNQVVIASTEIELTTYATIRWPRYSSGSRRRLPLDSGGPRHAVAIHQHDAVAARLDQVDGLAATMRCHAANRRHRDIAVRYQPSASEKLAVGIRAVKVASKQRGPPDLRCDGISVVRNGVAGVRRSPGLHPGHRRPPSPTTLAVGPRRQRDQRFRGTVPLSSHGDPVNDTSRIEHVRKSGNARHK